MSVGLITQSDGMIFSGAGFFWWRRKENMEPAIINNKDVYIHPRSCVNLSIGKLEELIPKKTSGEAKYSGESQLHLEWEGEGNIPRSKRGFCWWRTVNYKTNGWNIWEWEREWQLESDSDICRVVWWYDCNNQPLPQRSISCTWWVVFPFPLQDSLFSLFFNNLNRMYVGAGSFQCFLSVSLWDSWTYWLSMP